MCMELNSKCYDVGSGTSGRPGLHYMNEDALTKVMILGNSS